MPARGNRKPPVPVGDRGDRHSIEAHLVEFGEWMGVRGYSPRTIEDRTRRLRLVQVWLAERGVTRTAEVTKPMLDRYQRYLFHYRQPNGQPLTFLTQKGRLSPVRAFFKWATKTNRILFNPASELELPRVEHRLPRYVLTVEEVEATMCQPDLTDPLGVRDRAILEVLYSCGLRRSEVVRLRLFDVDAVRGSVFVDQGKNHKDRVVPIGERALAWLDRYVTQVRAGFVVEPDDGWLFLGLEGHPLSPASATTRVRRYLDGAGISKAGSCHLFRHTMATLMLEGGADIRFIQAILGHAELSTTQIYTHVSVAQLRAIHAATHPGSANKPSRDRELGDDETSGVEAARGELLDALDGEADHENGDESTTENDGQAEGREAS